MTEVAAQAAITNIGLAVGASSQEHNAAVAGNVIRTNPASGTDVALGTTVSLVVSQGPAQATTTPATIPPPTDWLHRILRNVRNVIVGILAVALLAAMIYIVATRKQQTPPENLPANPPTTTSGEKSPGGAKVDAQGVSVNCPVDINYQVREWYYPGAGMRVERVNLGAVAVEGDRQAIASQLGAVVCFPGTKSADSSGPPTHILSSELARDPAFRKKRVDVIHGHVEQLRQDVTAKFGGLSSKVDEQGQRLAAVEQGLHEVKEGNVRIMAHLGVEPKPPAPEPVAEPAPAPEPPPQATEEDVQNLVSSSGLSDQEIKDILAKDSVLRKIIGDWLQAGRVPDPEKWQRLLLEAEASVAPSNP
jgi:hypothetical protein